MSDVSKILDWAGFRTMAAWFTDVIHSLWEQAADGFVATLGQSAYAANNAVYVGLSENYYVLCPNFVEPTENEQIYTTQTEWDFNEEQELQLGDIVTIDGIDYPIPSLVYDTNNNSHIVFPVWWWSSNGGFAFRPKTITYRHNASYLGGNLDGYGWDSLIFTASTWSLNVVTLTTASSVKIGTWVRLTDDTGNLYAGWVSAIDSINGTINCTIMNGTDMDISIVELYKPRIG